MRLKSVFSGLAALVLGLSLSPAFGGTLLVDNFNDMGTPPTSGNQWIYTAGSGVIQGAGSGVRQLDKNNGSAFKWGKQTSPDTALKMTSTGTGNSLNLRYDGTPGTSTSQLFPTPRPNFTGMTHLNVETPSVAVVTGTTKVIATIDWFNVASGGSRKISTLTLNNGPIAGGYSFKLSSFGIPVTGSAYLGALTVRLQGLGAGTTLVDTIYFSSAAVPEPSTLALAGLGVVGLVMARRKRRA